MAESWASAWQTAEERTAKWLASKLGQTFGKNAYVGEIPKNFAYTDREGMWWFGIQGGGTPQDYEFNMNTPGACNERLMSAEFEGVWTDRADAQAVAGKLMDILPCAEYAIKQVRRLRITSDPSITRAVVQRKEDLALGGDCQVWRVRVELEILIKKVA